MGFGFCGHCEGELKATELRLVLATIRNRPTSPVRTQPVMRCAFEDLILFLGVDDVKYELLRLLNERGVHPDDFPDVAVEVLEAATIHKAILHRFAAPGTSCSQGLVGQ